MNEARYARLEVVIETTMGIRAGHELVPGVDDQAVIEAIAVGARRVYPEAISVVVRETDRDGTEMVSDEGVPAGRRAEA